MKIARWIARALCSVVFVIVCFYTVVAAVIAFYIVTGTLIPGEIMYFDLRTPSLADTVQFILAGSIVAAVFAFVRNKLKPNPA